ncbi:uroporphyrinogen-III C-methyltransferase [Isachenkonia alkalipeptolytica]|uniref:uroporphyrinogen-III C-methyltransferase n=1 Tax=Isachenkonia alkalipeptolytica TaxID=2565777 RepID=A0AA43XIV7_9CLOT|nr:uroporphyrinogen-III C-methyltransferase [Isachenkonia alkalipeptolytica]NBG87096.1 uroporphyrinogen-III C-methyltransferase [Isachenkonia alkalipeptolytica]
MHRTECKQGNQTENKPGKVYLVGAGPGDEELITLKGVRAIEEADVILYDRLSSPGLLRYQKSGTELIDVGKKPDHHKVPQEEINKILIDKALEGKIVTRIKGGDPFVFGRGGEEALSLEREGILYEVVPGITSAIAVPAYGGIPVTQRNISTSFHVITGHENPEKEEAMVDYSLLAKLQGTLIFLMGIKALPNITKKLLNEGMKPNTKAAVIHRGTTAKEKKAVGTLETIVEEVKKKKIISPGIIVVGEVAGFSDQMDWRRFMPLKNKRILLTRSRKQASTLRKQLMSLGAEVVEYPSIKIVEEKEPGKLSHHILQLKESGAANLFFSSPNGVEAFFDGLKVIKKDIRNLKDMKITAIGESTKKALENRGVMDVEIPESYTLEGALEMFAAKLQNGDILYHVRGSLGRDLLEKELSKKGIQVIEKDFYSTERPKDSGDLKEILSRGIDAITFTSSSTVQFFLESLSDEVIDSVQKSKIFAIGPVTAETAKSFGLTVDTIASPHTIKGLVDAMVKDVKEE